MANATATETSEKSKIWGVITASSVGTLIEWYDFYIFGSLAVVISTQFFPKTNPTAAFLSTLATFAAGFIVRPFGALFFGRLGDLVGRKYTFLVTLVLMGGSTFMIGLIPTYDTIGFMAPVLVLLLRLLQGLALGGEYGGAATYVAEHSPANQRGYFTSFIQTTATLGLFVSLGVILMVRLSMDVDSFNSWGWRIPFLISIFLIIISIYIRLKMHESPLFNKIKKEGKISANPLAESFTKKDNLKMVLLALFGATMGQGVVWYTGQFYAMSFLKTTCNVEAIQSEIIISIALVFATPFFVVFGALSDKIGRRNIMLGGMLIAILTYIPIYNYKYSLADLKNKTEIKEKTKVDVKAALEKGKDGNPTQDSLITTTTTKAFTDGSTYKEVKKEKVLADKSKEKPKPEVSKQLTLANGAMWIMVFLIFIQVFYVTMVYGPIAAYLVEIFPTRIRYTSMSLPYHIGNGVFGGLLPYIATRLVEATRPAADQPPTDVTAGLLYPIVIAGVCFVIGMLYMGNKVDENVED
ncbi:MAG: MFS transporter [Cytophagales bacterium]|nr:MAG: MFS transporter [Cytophagales bacterium]